MASDSAMLEDQPVALEAVAPEASEPLEQPSELDDAPAVLEDQPVALDASEPLDTSEPLDAPAVPVEQLSELNDVQVAVDAVAPTEIGSLDTPEALEHESVDQDGAGPGASETVEELSELEAGAVANGHGSQPEPAELPDIVMPNLPTQDLAAGNGNKDELPDPPTTLDGGASVVAEAVAGTTPAPKSPNGIAPKSRSGRGSRRQPPAAEPTGKPNAKRRSSGSKRKQTT